MSSGEEKLHDGYTSQMTQEYFQNLLGASLAWQAAAYYVEHIGKNVTLCLEEDDMHIGRSKKNAVDLLEHPEPTEMEQQEARRQAQKQQIESQLNYLRSQTEDVSLEVTPTSGVYSKEEHKKVVNRLKKEWESRDQQKKAELELMEVKMKEDEEREKQIAKQKKEEQLKKRRELIEAKLEQNRHRHEEFLKAQKESRPKVRAVSEMNNLEQKRYRELETSALEQKKKRLKELRDYRSFNAEQILEHQQNYLQKRALHMSRQTATNDFNYRPPPRSQRMTLIMEEQELAKMQAIQEKQKAFEDKMEKRERYIKYLRQNFSPTVDPQKQKEIEERLQKSQVTKPEPKDSRAVGLDYLDEAKKRRKKKIVAKPESPVGQLVVKPDPQNPSQVIEQPKDNSLPEIPKDYNPSQLHTVDASPNRQSVVKSRANRTIHRSTQGQQKRRREELAKLSGQQKLGRAEKVARLKIEANKLEDALKRKEAEVKWSVNKSTKDDSVQLLLSTIAAKVGILENSR